MSFWVAGRKAVEETFFKDRVSLYAVTISENQLNEDIESAVLVGTYKCNVESGGSGVSRNESGSGSPQTLRISLPKAVQLSYSQTYKVKVKSARIRLDSQEFWRVDGWTEAQLSTVMSVSRGVSV